MTFLRSLAAALLLATAPLCAADVQPAPEPDWIVPAELPAAGPELVKAASGGRLFLLIDDQARWDGDTRHHYARRALKITQRSGLEASASIDWKFLPDFMEVALGRLHVIRDGKVIDLTHHLRPEILRRESRLEAGILDGSLTAHYTVPDLRVGDVIDYSFIMAERPLIPGATFSGQRPLEYFQPVGMTRVVLNWPAHKALHLGPLPERVEHRQTDLPGIIRHEWTRQNHLPFRREEGTPLEGLREATLRFSVDADWGPTVTALLPLYAKGQVLPPDWAEKVRRIREGNSDDLSRASAALRMVQDEIRYVGIEIGIGGIVPRKPVQVAAQGFGDCKDKSLLLRTMLEELGIEAEVALTDLDEGKALYLQQPGLSEMDHMIVRARIGGNVYWMDPTATDEAGRLDHAAVPDYGYALPLAPGVTALERIIVPAHLGYMTYTTEDFRFGVNGVSLKVTSIFHGAAANMQRRRIAVEPIDLLGSELFSFFAARYPGLQADKPLEVDDNREMNRLTVVETYLLPYDAMFENDLWSNFDIAAEDYGIYFPKGVTKRLTPLDIGLPKVHHHTVLVSNAPLWFAPPDPVEVRNDAFTFLMRASAAQIGQLRVEWDFRTRMQVIPAETVAAVARDAEKVSNASAMSWNLGP